MIRFIFKRHLTTMATVVPSIKLNTGYDMPVIAFGTFNMFKENEVRNACKVAIDNGYRHFDTAWVYTTEHELGDAITSKINEGVVKRSDLFLTTKLWNNHHDPKNVEDACRDSLKKMKTEYLDLLLMHWPFGVEAEDKSAFFHSDNLQPSKVHFIDTWRAMEELVIKGLVRSIGVSNFNTDQLQRLCDAKNLRYKPAVIQVEIHPYYTNNEIVNYCKDKNITLTGYSPLGKGGSKYTNGEYLPNIMTEPVVLKIAENRNKTPAQVLVRWGLQRGYTLNVKSITPSRIQENIQAFDFSLTEDEIKDIGKLDRNFKMVTLDKFKNYPEYPFKWLI